MVRYICQGPALGEYTAQEAEALQRPDIAGHTRRGVPAGNGQLVPCGYDLTELYGAVPEDGEDYTVECPRCGNVSRLRKVASAEPDAERERVVIGPEDVGELPATLLDP